MTSPYTRGRAALGLTFPSVLALLTFASTASAEQECGDFTCADGFVCNTFQADCPACEEGADCPACDAQTFHSCDRAPCESDADCGDFMVCGSFEVQCAQLLIACEPGLDCPAPPECEASEFTQCAPVWDLPCTADADCGEGFLCEKQVCECSVADVPSEDEKLLDEPTCDDCYEADEGWCNLQEIECDEDADCPADWTCAEVGLIRCDADGNCDDGGSLSCQPPWDKVQGQSDAVQDIATTGLPQTSTAALGEPGVAETDGAATNDSATESDPMTVVDDDDVMHSPNSGKNASSGGCSVGEAASSSLAGLGWLSLALGLVFGTRRRRS